MKSEFIPTDKSPKTEYKGKTYYFCCPDCVEKFNKEPEKYLKSMKKGKMCKECDEQKGEINIQRSKRNNKINN
jgi:YHS domain-containing protein